MSIKNELTLRLAELAGMKKVLFDKSKSFPWKNKSCIQLEMLDHEYKYLINLIERID